MHISTHSLTRRLTHDTCCTTLQTRYFNSQPHKEADEFLVSDTIAYFIFQLTASQGGWLCSGRCSADEWKFQLTASQGGWRSRLQTHPESSHISTHSLTRRLTYTASNSCMRSEFQLTASQGGWRLIEDICEKFEVFQLTASQGGWQRDDILTHRQQDFNSQPHKEADSYAPDHKVRLQSFQLTASQGGWLFHHFTVSTLGLFQLTASQGGWLPREPMTIIWKNISTHSLTRRLTTSKKDTIKVALFQLTASQGGWHQRFFR